VVCPMHRCPVHGPFGSSPNARGICLTGESVLQSSTQHHVMQHFDEILDPERRIAIVIGHEEACGIRDRALRGRNTRSFIARLEDLGDDRQTRAPALS